MHKDKIEEVERNLLPVLLHYHTLRTNSVGDVFAL